MGSFVRSLFNIPESSGQNLTLTFDTSRSRDLILGTTAVAGNFTYGGLSDDDRGDNRDLSRVIVLSGHPVVAMRELWVNGEKVSRTSFPHGQRVQINEYNDGGISRARLWVTFYDGRSNQTADSFLLSSGMRPLPYRSTDRLRGCAYLVITMRHDNDVLQSELTFRAVLDGARLYDRRQDSTAGGSGTQRYGDPDTWAFTDNARVAIDHYQLGMVGGENNAHLIFGMGQDPAWQAPYEEFEANADLCDEIVDGIARYAVNGILSAGDNHSTNLTKMSKQMAARPYDDGGNIVVRPVQARPITMTITDADLVGGTPFDLDNDPGSADLVNTIRGTYLDPTSGYSTIDYPFIQDEELVSRDGRPFELTLDLDLENNPMRAQRIAMIELNTQKRRASLNEDYMPRANALGVGDWYNRVTGLRGEVTKTYEVVEITYNEDWTVSVEAVETDPSVSAVNPDDLRAVVLPSPPAPLDRGLLPDPPSITSVVGAFDQGGGAETPSAVLTIAPPEDSTLSTAEYFEVEYGPSNGLSGAALGILLGQDRFTQIANEGQSVLHLPNLLPATTYAARVRTTSDGRSTAYGPYVEVTTTSNLISTNTVSVGSMSALDLLTNVAANVAGLIDLTVVFGDTVSAAASAEAAQFARDEAQSIQNATNDILTEALGEAQTATEQAELAVAAATQTAQDVQATAADAVTVSAFATEVAQGAAATETDRIAAQTARAGSETARDISIQSVTEAEGAAATATQQADIASNAATQTGQDAQATAQDVVTTSAFATDAEQAAAATAQDVLAANTARAGSEAAEGRTVTARDDAEGFAATATQQAGLASVAATQTGQDVQATSQDVQTTSAHVTAAGVSAAAASSNALTATAASSASFARALETGPSDLFQIEYFTDDIFSAIPDNSETGYGPPVGFSVVTNDALLGNCVEGSAKVRIAPRKTETVLGKTHLKITVAGRIETDSTNGQGGNVPQIDYDIRLYNASGVSVGAATTRLNSSNVSADGVWTYESVFSLESLASNVTDVRPYLQINTNNTNATYRLKTFLTEDWTARFVNDASIAENAMVSATNEAVIAGQQLTIAANEATLTDTAQALDTLDGQAVRRVIQGTTPDGQFTIAGFVDSLGSQLAFLADRILFSAGQALFGLMSDRAELNVPLDVTRAGDVVSLGSPNSALWVGDPTISLAERTPQNSALSVVAGDAFLNGELYLPPAGSVYFAAPQTSTGTTALTATTDPFVTRGGTMRGAATLTADSTRFYVQTASISSGNFSSGSIRLRTFRSLNGGAYVQIGATQTVNGQLSRTVVFDSENSIYSVAENFTVNAKIDTDNTDTAGDGVQWRVIADQISGLPTGHTVDTRLEFFVSDP